MAVGIVLPIFALGASALGVTAEWARDGCFLKGLLGAVGGVGTNGIFDWLRSRWFTRAPGAKALLENHHLAQLTGTALRRSFELAAAEAEIVDAEKRGLALHAARLRALAAVVEEKWLSLVDDEQTPQFDALRSAQLTELVTSVCKNEGASPVLDVADWEPLVRGVDALEGGKSLSPQAIAHTARVLRERVARLFYELVKDARETSPEAYAALQLHFFADLKTAASEQRDDLRAMRAELETLTATLADGAGETTRKVKFNWARLTAMLRPMNSMAAEWREFYAKHDQRWDELLAKISALPDDTARTVWERVPPWLRSLRVAVPLLIAVLLGGGYGAWRLDRWIKEQREQNTGTQDELRKLRETIATLAKVADGILGGPASQSGAAEARPGAALAEAAAVRGQKPDELRAQLAETAAKAAKLAAESKGAEARELWRKAGDLASAAGERAEAERHYRAALALSEKGSALWCDIAGDVARALDEQTRSGDAIPLLAEIVKHRAALGDITALTIALENQRDVLEGYGHYVEAEEVARRIIALEPKFPATPVAARAKCLAALLSAQSQLGDYREILRISGEFDALPHEPTDEGRSNAQLGLLNSATYLLAYDDLDGALDRIERAAALEVADPGKRRSFIQQGIRTLSGQFSGRPIPPRAKRLLDTLLRQADALIAQDFARFGTLLHTKAVTLADASRYDEQLTLVREGLALARKNFPAGHVEIALWQTDVAVLLKSPDEQAEAEALWATALPLIEARMGAGHSTPMGIKAERAHFFGMSGRVAKAESEFREILATVSRVLTRWHPRIIGAKLDVLATLTAPEHAAEARELREEIYATLREHPRPEHRYVQQIYQRYTNLRLTNAELTRFAGDLDRLTLGAEARLGAATYLRAQILFNLYNAFERAGLTQRASDTVPRILRAATPVFGADSLLMAKMHGLAASSYSTLGDTKSAEAALRTALGIAEKSGNAIARQLSELSRLLKADKRQPEAKVILERAVQLLDQHPNDDPALRYDTMGSLAMSHAVAGDFPGAEKMLRRSLDEEEKQFGFDPYVMERRYADLGWVLHDQKRDAEAEKAFLRVLSTPYNNPDGTESLRVCDALFGYFSFLIEIGRAREAVPRLQRLLAPGPYPPPRDAEESYFRVMRALGWADAAIRKRLDRVMRGENVGPL